MEYTKEMFSAASWLLHASSLLCGEDPFNCYIVHFHMTIIEEVAGGDLVSQYVAAFMTDTP